MRPRLEGWLLAPCLASILRGTPLQALRHRKTSHRRMRRAKTYFASSFDRFVAAATARIISGCMPPSPISTSSAAAVVPPGEVTFLRKRRG